MNVVIPILGVYRNGGVRVLTEIANGLAARGIAVTLVTGPCEQFPFPLNSSVRRVSFRPGCRNVHLRQAMCVAWVLRRLWNTSGVLISNYYVTAYLCWFVATARSRSHIYFVQGDERDFFRMHRGVSRFLKKALASLSYWLPVCRRVTISNFLYRKIGRRDTLIINDGVDLGVFNPGCRSDGVAAASRIATIVYQEERKGFHDVLRAFEVLRKDGIEFEIQFFGPQEEFTSPAGYATAYHRIESDEDLVRCFRRSSIFVSASYTEGFGLPGLEAMACGCVLVTSASGGVSEYAAHGENALVFEPGDVMGLVDCLRQLLADPVMANRLRQNGVARAQQLSIGEMQDKFAHLLAEVL